MPWCPICKNEYVEGITKCSDCNTDLVDSKADISTYSVICGEKEQMEKFVRFLEFNELNSGILRYNDNSEIYDVYVTQEEYAKAKKIAIVFVHEELMMEPETESEDEIKNKKELEKAPAYQKKADKAEDYKSSAYTLISVGFIGVIALVLIGTGIIDLNLTKYSKFMTLGILGLLFFIFIVTGFNALHSYRRLKVEGDMENQLEKEILDWCRKNITQKNVDEQADIVADLLSEEEKYFKRFEVMKKMVSNKYLNLEEVFLEKLMDDLYMELFQS